MQYFQRKINMLFQKIEDYAKTKTLPFRSLERVKCTLWRKAAAKLHSNLEVG